MAWESSTSPRSPLDTSGHEESEEPPQMQPTGKLATFLKRRLQIDAQSAYSLALALNCLNPKTDATDPCLIMIYDTQELQARAAGAHMTIAAMVQTLDGAFSNYGAQVRTWAGTQPDKITKAYFLKTFEAYQTALDSMRDDPALQWAYTPRVAGAAGQQAPAQRAITSADLLFTRADTKASTGDCSRVGFFFK